MSILRYLKPVADPPRDNPETEAKAESARKFGAKCRKWLRIDKLEARMETEVRENPKRTAIIIALIIILVFSLNIYRIYRVAQSISSAEVNQEELLPSRKKPKVKALAPTEQDEIKFIKEEGHDTETDQL